MESTPEVTNHLVFQLTVSDALDGAVRDSLGRLYLPRNPVVMITVYRINRKRPYLADQVQLSLQSLDVRAIMLKGPVSYLRSENVEIGFSPDVNDMRPGTKVQLAAPPNIVADRAEGDAFLALVTPLPLSEDQKLGDKDVRPLIDERLERLLAAAGLVAVVGGREFVHQRVFTNFLDLEASVRSVVVAITIPLYFDRPELDRAGHERVLDIDRALASREDKEVERLKWSLSWYARAAEADGPEAFLALWIAMEALVQAEGKQALDSLVRQLAHTYGERPHILKASLKLGRLYGVRKRVAHEGSRAVGEPVVRYMEDVYMDLLSAVLQLAPTRRAARSLAYWRPAL